MILWEILENSCNISQIVEIYIFPAIPDLVKAAKKTFRLGKVKERVPTTEYNQVLPS